MAFGTFSVLDTLAASRTTVAVFGEERAWELIDAANAAHNALLNDALDSVGLERTTDRLRRFGDVASMVMEELDEYGRPQAQKISPAGQNVGFPLRRYGMGLQWTRTALLVMPTAQMAAQVTEVYRADAARVRRELLRAIFNPTNYTFTDALVDGYSLDVKRLTNADGGAGGIVPADPFGNTFDATTHTHYLARVSTFAASDLTSLITAVTEHYSGGRPVVYANQAQEAAIRAFTGFAPYIDSRLIVPGGATATVAQGSLDMMNTYNRAIGVFGQAEIWIKPWIPANYLYATVLDQPSPLVMRTREGNNGDLAMAFEDESHPLRARGYEREFGLGIWNRTNGAVLYVGGTTYTAPAINVS